MSTIITLANQKGGVGKTALCVNLAHAFKENVKTAIVDLDPQGSATQSMTKMRDIEVLPYPVQFDEINSQVVFVDTPPYLHEKLPEIMAASDLVLIPVRAGVWDVLATESTINLVKEVQAKNPGVKAALLFNMINSSTTLTDEAEKALAEFGIPVLKTRITERVCFGRSASFPDGIYSMSDRKAISEMDNLTKEILFLLRN